MLEKLKRKEREKQDYSQEEKDVNPMEQLENETQGNTEPETKEKIQKIDDNERWVVGEIATSTEKVIHDKENQKSYDIYSAIALILNKLENN